MCTLCWISLFTTSTRRCSCSRQSRVSDADIGDVELIVRVAARTERSQREICNYTDWKRGTHSAVQHVPGQAVSVVVNRFDVGQTNNPLWVDLILPFLPRCMECRRGLAMRIPSVCLSVCLSVRPSVCASNAWIVTKRQKDMFTFLHDTKDNLS